MSRVLIIAVLLCLLASVYGKPKLPKQDDCSLCTYVAGIAEGWLAANATVEEVEQFLDQICQFTPDATDCTNFVNQNLPAIIQYLEQNEDPKTVCTQLGFCTSPKKSGKPINIVHQVGQDDCSLCKYVVGVAETWLAANATEEQIEQFLDQICQFTPDATDCTNFVNQNLPTIIQYLEQNEDPDTICQQLGMCNSTKGCTKPMKKPKLPKQDDCSLCKYVVGIAESWLAANATEQQIEQFLDQICQFTPDATDCTNFVNQNLPTIIEYLEQNEDPDTICQQLGMCNSTMKAKPKKMPKQDDCALCKYVVGIAESWLAQNATEQQIEQFLDQICQFTPDPTDCTNFVNQNLATIIQYLEQNEDPDTICQQLGMCNSTKTVPFKFLGMKKLPADGCDTCQKVIGALETYMAENATESQIEKVFENYLCVYISDWQQTCDAIVEAGWPQVINWVNNAENPKVVCIQLDICTSNVKNSKISIF